MVEIPKISDKEVAKIEREIEMMGERHVFQQGERVKIIKIVDSCPGPGNIGNKCDLVGKFGTVHSMFPRSSLLLVALDDTVPCTQDLRNACLIDESALVSMNKRLILSIHQVKRKGFCESKSCGKESKYVVFEYVKGNCYEVCPTHAIEWLNIQYQQMADLISTLNKLIKKSS